MKKFQRYAMLCLTVILCLAIAACSLSSTLSTIGADISKFSPLLSLAEAAACPINPAVCGAVTAFVNAATPLASKVGQGFSTWSTASATAAPGDLSQLIVAVDNWNTQLRQGLTIPGVNPEYDSLIEAEMGACTSVMTLLQGTSQYGGTTQAMLRLLNEATPLDGDGSAANPMAFMAMWNPVASIGHVTHLRAPRTYRLKNGAVVHTWAYHRDRLIDKLSKPTGDKARDANNAKVLAAVKKLG